MEMACRLQWTGGKRWSIDGIMGRPEFQSRCKYWTFLSELPQENCAPTAEGNCKVYLAQMAAGGGCITGSPALYDSILPIYTIEWRAYRTCRVLCAQRRTKTGYLARRHHSIPQFRNFTGISAKVHRGYPFGISDRRS